MGYTRRNDSFCRMRLYERKLHLDDIGETRKVRESQRKVTKAKRSGSLISSGSRKESNVARL